jgi:hypothetical protein
MLDPDPYPDPDSMNPDPQHWVPFFISFALAGLHNSVNPVDLRFKTFFPFWIKKTKMTHKKNT